MRSQESLSYLERVIIRLEQNPPAIKLVCSPEGPIKYPQVLYWGLLSMTHSHQSQLLLM